MERKNLLTMIIVVALVLGFITELFYFGGSFSLPFLGGQSSQPSENVTGNVTFNGTIRTYEPVLGIPVNTSAALLDGIRKLPGVKDVRTQSTLILVDTETRDDVYPLAVALREMNLSPIIGVANIAIPPELTVETAGGPVNATALNGMVQIETEPLVDAGGEVPVSMGAVVRDGLLLGFYNQQVVSSRSSFMADAAVESLTNMTMSYVIPWEARDSIGLQDLAAYDYQYRKTNTVVFSPPLTVGDIKARKSLPYITYIDAGSAEVAPNFTSTDGVAGDFADVNVTFLPSALVIRAPSVPELKGRDGGSLDYAPSISYSYVLRLPGTVGGYDIGDVAFEKQTGSPLELNSTVQVNVTILALGSKVLSVTPAG